MCTSLVARLTRGQGGAGSNLAIRRSLIGPTTWPIFNPPLGPRGVCVCLHVFGCHTLLTS